MEIALDTNALSAFADGEKNIYNIIRDFRRLALPATVLGEYRFGLKFSRYREQRSKWLSELLKHSRILEIDEITTNYYADIRSILKRQGTPLPENDVWIASSCIQYNLSILSRDKHFDNLKNMTRLSW